MRAQVRAASLPKEAELARADLPHYPPALHAAIEREWNDRFHGLIAGLNYGVHLYGTVTGSFATSLQSVWELAADHVGEAWTVELSIARLACAMRAGREREITELGETALARCDAHGDMRLSSVAAMRTMQAYEQLGDWEAMRRWAEAAEARVEDWGRNGWTASGLCRYYDRAGLHDRAADLAEKVLAANRDRPGVGAILDSMACCLSRARFEAGDFAAALAAVKPVVARGCHPDGKDHFKVTIRWAAAEALHRLDQPDRARELLVVAREPGIRRPRPADPLRRGNAAESGAVAVSRRPARSPPSRPRPDPVGSTAGRPRPARPRRPRSTPRPRRTSRPSPPFRRRR